MEKIRLKYVHSFDKHQVIVFLMNKIIPKLIIGIFAFGLIFLPFLSGLAVPSVGAFSCSVTILAENGGNNAIQLALNNAADGVTGKTICVGSGTFPEQLNITSASASHISLVGLGTSSNPTIIMPNSVVTNSRDFDNSGLPEAAIILVGNSTSSSLTGVSIHNLLVNGASSVSSFSGCASDYMGILYQDASGTVSNNTVENTYLPPADYGCQDGQGVYVQTDSGLASTLSITNNHVINYNKNGITCNDVGTTCTIQKNTVYPFASVTPFIAPNGIQIGFGAVGNVRANSISGNVCDLSPICGPNPSTQTQSCGILTYSSGTGTIVSGNTATANQVGICGVLDSAPQNSNVVSASTAYAVLQYDGTYSASKNTLTNNPAGFVIISDGFGPNDVSTIKSNNHFTSDSILLEILTTIPGTATVHYGGHTYLISGNANVTIS